jgi:hypothetical protein
MQTRRARPRRGSFNAANPGSPPSLAASAFAPSTNCSPPRPKPSGSSPRGCKPTITSCSSASASSRGRLRAPRGHYLDLVAEQDTIIASGRALDPASALDAQQAAQTLARAARDMTVFAFDNAGTTVVLATNPLQRCLRDIFIGLKHAILTPAILGRIGKVRLGLDYGAVGF